ncbi:MAG TPA: hypothetical protein VH186_30090 [Chloroflexia bacterium]|nr:hypothetical protein [Chloroflexia bacterium]
MAKASKQSASEIYKDRKLLERLGYGIMDVSSSSGVGFEDVRNFSYVAAPEQSPHFYRSLLLNLTGHYYPDALARLLWNKLLEHQKQLAETAGSEVDLPAASKDFFPEISEGIIKDWCLNLPAKPPGRLNTQVETTINRTTLVLLKVLPGLFELLEMGFFLPEIIRIAWSARSPDTGKRNLFRHLASLSLRRKIPATWQPYFIQLVAELTGHPCFDQAVFETYCREVLLHWQRVAVREKRAVDFQEAALDYFLRLNLMERILKGDPL